MAKDLTWNQLQQDIGIQGCIQISNNSISIDVSILTGQTYTDLNALGVAEFVHKLLNACNKSQVRINQGVEVGQRLAAFPSATLGTPSKDSDGVLRVTATQQVATRLTVDANQVVGNQN